MSQRLHQPVAAVSLQQVPEAIDYALLIGEMEGVSQHLQKIGDGDDLDIINDMKKKYYKVYFTLLKEQRLRDDA